LNSRLHGGGGSHGRHLSRGHGRRSLSSHRPNINKLKLRRLRLLRRTRVLRHLKPWVSAHFIEKENLKKLPKSLICIFPQGVFAPKTSLKESKKRQLGEIAEYLVTLVTNGGLQRPPRPSGKETEFARKIGFNISPELLFDGSWAAVFVSVARSSRTGALERHRRRWRRRSRWRRRACGHQEKNPGGGAAPDAAAAAAAARESRWRYERAQMRRPVG